MHSKIVDSTFTCAPKLAMPARCVASMRAEDNVTSVSRTLASNANPSPKAPLFASPVAMELVKFYFRRRAGGVKG